MDRFYFLHKRTAAYKAFLTLVLVFIVKFASAQPGPQYTFIKTLQQSPRIDLYDGNITDSNGFFNTSDGSVAVSTSNWSFSEGTSFGGITITDKPAGDCSFSFVSSVGVYAVAVKGANRVRVYYFDTPQFSGTLSSVLKSDVTAGATGCWGVSHVVFHRAPCAVGFTQTSTDVSCNGAANGSITVTPNGNTSISLRDGSGNEVPGVNNVFSALAPGTYTVRGTSTLAVDYGCWKETTVTITQPSELKATAAKSDVNCFGGATGSIDLSVSGGTAPYSYSWSNSSTAQDLSGLSAGSYSVTVTDARGCTFTESFTITQPASALSLSTSKIDVSCFGDSTGSADLTVNGGTAPYGYSWSNSATSEDLSAVPAGSYTVTVTDAKGCSESTTVTVEQPEELKASVKGTDVKCYGDSSGSADLTVSGNTAPYTYLWSNGATTEDISELAAGTYSVTITDANKCSTTASVTIEQPAAALSATISGTDVDCRGASTGSVDLSVSGGTEPYSYSWSDLSTTQDLSNVVAGTYSVTITDANGCIVEKSITIAEPAESLSASATKVDVSCFGQSTGSIDLTPAGGTAPYLYSWSNSMTTQDISGLAAGSYDVTVTDANGCSTTISVSVAQPVAALGATATKTDVKCFGESNGSVDLTVSGGTSPYSYSWSNGATTQDLSNLVAGTYDVTVTDAKSCSTTASVTVGQPYAALSVSTSALPVTCNGGSDGSATVEASGGNGGYSYSWNTSPVQLTATASGLKAGTYAVTVRDSKGCVTSSSVTVSQPESIAVTVTPSWPVCASLNAGGQVDATVTAGASVVAYSWTKDGQPFSGNTASISGLAPGVYEVTVTYINSAENTCSVKSTAVTVRKTCGLVYYSYTQGYYGNKNGNGCYQGTANYRSWDLAKRILTTNVNFGSNGRIFQIRSTDMATDGSKTSGGNFYTLMPGGGTPRAFAQTATAYTVTFDDKGNATRRSYIPMNSKGNLDNNLLSQTIALYLNIGNNPGSGNQYGNLGDLILENRGMVTAKGPSCGSQFIVNGSEQTFTIPSSVLSRLASYPGGATVRNLLQLSNDVMGGAVTNVSPSEVNAAVDAINRGFDQGRILVGWTNSARSIDELPVVEPDQDVVPVDVKVSTYPNPYIDRVNIEFQTPVDTRARVEVISLSGSKVSTLFDGEVKANTPVTAEFNEKPAAGSMYIYRIITPEGVKVGKLYYLQTNR